MGTDPRRKKFRDFPLAVLASGCPATWQPTGKIVRYAGPLSLSILILGPGAEEKDDTDAAQ